MLSVFGRSAKRFRWILQVSLGPNIHLQYAVCRTLARRPLPTAQLIEARGQTTPLEPQAPGRQQAALPVRQFPAPTWDRVSVRVDHK